MVTVDASVRMSTGPPTSTASAALPATISATLGGVDPSGMIANHSLPGSSSCTIRSAVSSLTLSTLGNGSTKSGAVASIVVKSSVTTVANRLGGLARSSATKYATYSVSSAKPSAPIVTATSASTSSGPPTSAASALLPSTTSCTVGGSALAGRTAHQTLPSSDTSMCRSAVVPPTLSTAGKPTPTLGIVLSPVVSSIFTALAIAFGGAEASSHVTHAS
mmetsp:Transcript_17728/g.62455  ORF Transcript_17728/g.62455 Transcript_17728/m.62455 type:complete len:219 (-) Transcript_17728:627-1283(-)